MINEWIKRLWKPKSYEHLEFKERNLYSLPENVLNEDKISEHQFNVLDTFIFINMFIYRKTNQLYIESMDNSLRNCVTVSIIINDKNVNYISIVKQNTQIE